MTTKFLPLFLIPLILSAGCISSFTTPTQNPDAKPEGGSPELMDVFTGYRRAVIEKDVENFKQYAATEVLERTEEELGSELNEESFDIISTVILRIVPPMEDIVVEKETVENGVGMWQLSNKKDENRMGTVEFYLEADGWKIVREEWQEI